MKKIDVACQMPKKLIWLEVFGSFWLIYILGYFDYLSMY
jgi:hypothetical protein